MHRVAFPADTEESEGTPERSLFSAENHKVCIPAYNPQMLGILPDAHPGVAADIQLGCRLSVILEPVHTIDRVRAIIVQRVSQHSHIFCAFQNVIYCSIIKHWLPPDF